MENGKINKWVVTELKKYEKHRPEEVPAGEQPNMSHTSLEISDRILDQGGSGYDPKNQRIDLKCV